MSKLKKIKVKKEMLITDTDGMTTEIQPSKTEYIYVNMDKVVFIGVLKEGGSKNGQR